MPAGGGESSSMAKKKNKKIHKRKRDEELERMDSLPWSSSIPIGEDDDGETFSTLFAGSAELDGGFLSLEEIDEADYNLAAFPAIESVETEKKSKSKKQARENNGGNSEAVEEIIEDEQDKEDEEEQVQGEVVKESRKIKEKKTKQKNKKKEKMKRVKEAEKDQDSSAVSCGEDNKVEELDGEQEITPEFSAWGLMRLHPLLMESIYQLGFKEPTEIQKACLSVAAFQGKDVIGAAETGSGKTLAFGLPILQRLLDEREKVRKMHALKGEEAQKYSADGYLRALIITPTRELALQVTDQLKNAAKNLEVRVVPIVGGMSSAKQERLLKEKPEIVVGTPGRLWELMSAGEKHLVELRCLSFFVLDEADRMVESGHFPELQSIIDLLPVMDRPMEGKIQTVQSSDTVSDAPKKKRQTFIFSATVAPSSDFRKKLKRGSKSKQSSSGEVNSIEVLSERVGMRDNVAIIDLTTAAILEPKSEESFIKNVSCDEDNKVEELDGEEEIPPEFSAWSLMRLHPLLMKSIYHLGFKEPTEIQKACFSVAAFQGKDVIGAAETGSGKTLAFGLPILQRLLDEREKVGKMYALKGKEAQKYSADGYLRALIITPTRELALQVTDHLKNAAKNLEVRVVPIVGGMSSAKQERLLKEKPEIVVGTPGRLWELMSAGEKHLVELHCLTFFVLDEADRMVESGHFRELQSIIDLLPVTDRPNEGKMQTVQSSDTVSDAPKKKRQTFVFSATIALSSDFRKKLKRGSSKSKQSSSGEVNSIEVLSERAGMRDSVAIIDLTTAAILAPKIEESFIKCEEEEKDVYLYYILSVHGQGRTIVFCTSVAALRHICALLKILGIDVCKLFSDMKQRARLKAIDRFRASENGILIATDVAARGIDIKNVRTVIHYQLPHSAEVYVHRSGRTARAFADGCSIALIAPNDTSKFYTLCKSFSKESVKIFPLDNSYMPAVRKRLSLARQIDQIERKGSRERVDRTWLEKHAELMELELDEDESEEEKVDNVRQRKATSAQLKKLQEELSSLLSRPMQPNKFSDRYFAGRGMSPLLQNQLAELTNQKQPEMQTGGDKKRRKLVVVAQNCIEPLQALRDGGKEVMNMKGQSADKRRDIATLRKKRKEEKIGRRDQRRDQKKKRKLMASS